MTDSEDEGSLDDECPINEEWLEDVLGCYHSDYQKLQPPPSQDLNVCVKVGDFAMRPGCAMNECVLSDIVAVTVDYKLLKAVERGREAEESSHSLSLVVKLLPNDPFSRLFVTEAQFDLREISFYTKVVPELQRLDPDEPLPIPKCYHARYTPATDTAPPESLLVLDNLKVQGYKGQPFSLGLTLPQARAALEAMARLHALSLVLKIKEGQPLSERYPFLFAPDRASESYQELVERGMPQVDAFLKHQPGMEAVQRALDALRPVTKDVMAQLLAPAGQMALITHTDFWCNNLLFRDSQDGEGDGTPQCSVLDWQMVTYSRPTNDVALLLLSSLPTQLRRNHEEELVDQYWRAFTATTSRLGVEVETELAYDRRRLDADLKTSKLLAILLCIGSVEVAIGDPLTEQRLIDVLSDLHGDGSLQPPASSPNETAPEC